MNWTAISRHAFRLAAGLAVALTASWLLRQANLNRFTAADAEGINSLISLIGSIYYAVVCAFVIFFIWGQFTAVEEASQRECTFLNDLLRFAQYLDPDSNRAIRRAVRSIPTRLLTPNGARLAKAGKISLLNNPSPA